MNADVIYGGEEHRDKSKRKKDRERKGEVEQKEKYVPVTNIIELLIRKYYIVDGESNGWNLDTEREERYMADNNLLCTINNIILAQHSER